MAGYWPARSQNGSRAMPSDPLTYRRHDFVRLTEDWRAIDSGPCSQTAIDTIEAWRAAGHSFVVTRRLEHDEASIVRLGLATPAKLRLGFTVDRRAIGERRAPPTLREVAVMAPPGWRSVIERLLALERELPVSIGVFGSMAWQLLTGFNYLREESDLDLLLTPQRSVDLIALASALAEISGKPRLDGEIRFPDGAGVAWRELVQAPQRVLVKMPAGLSLRPLDDLLGWGELA